MNKKTALVILDGWGHGDRSISDGIFNAETPFMDHLEATAPNAELLTHGEHVGLPKGQMGNSEVGHLNIGAGRIVYQELTRINKAIKDGDFQKNLTLLQAIKKVKEGNCKLHLMGLVSTGGVHSSLDHLIALCDLVDQHQLENVFIHAFTDGRDCNPKTGKGHLQKLLKHLETSKIRVASIIGRYYAMDRDQRWERIKKAYDLLTKGEGSHFSDPMEAIEASYEQNITDEFIEPIAITKNGSPVSKIEEGDVVICFNFRTDRCREITQVLTQSNMDEHRMNTIPVHYVTMTNYDKSFKDVHVIFDNENLTQTLGEVIAEHNKSQLRIAETEKYPHVSFFFSGGRERLFESEERVMIPSPKVATYDLEPQMSAKEITEATKQQMAEHQPDFICLNFANTDMVGHTGVYEAIKKSASCVDSLLKDLVAHGSSAGYSFVIIADHGNSDFVINEDGSPNTAHSIESCSNNCN